MVSKNLGIGVGIAAVAVVAILAIFVIGSTNIQSNEEDVTVRIGYNKLIDSLPFFVALEKGYFDEEDIKIETFVQQDASFVASAMLANNLDMGVPIIVPDLIIIEDKDPGKIQLIQAGAETEDYRQMAILVKPDSSITSIQDVEGKRLATLTGTQGLVLPQLTFMNLFDPSNVKYVQMIPPNWINALETDQVDAIFAVEPVITISVNQGITKIITDKPMAKYVNDPHITVGSALTTKFIEEYPDTTNKIIKVMEKSAKFIKDNPEETRLIMTKHTEFPEELTQNLGWSLYDDATLYVSDIQVIADKMQELNFISKKIDVSDIVYLP